MAVHSDREAFIPYRRQDLISLCIEDGQLTAADVQKFRDFCSILSAYYHFQFHFYLETLKENFAPFDPDDETKERIAPTSEKRASMEARVVAEFKTILERANYVPLSPDSLQRAFEEKSLIELKTSVELNDFAQMFCYCRGDIYKVVWIKKFFKKVPKTIDVFERVVLLIKFQDEGYFSSKKVKIEKLNFTPGKMYIYLYKNIPKFDLEFLFPNIKTSMTWKDRLLFGVPAIGAAIPLLLKVLPQLLLVIGVILFITVGPESLALLGLSEAAVRNILPIFVAMLSVLVAFGGFAFKQYTSYKSKQIKFQKNVTETLFFRNLASNAGVFGALIDSAEEEECKEIILVYYHLLTCKTSLNPEQLDNRIEAWMEEKFGTKIDFDINGPLSNLEAIRGFIAKNNQDETNTTEVSLLTKDIQGNCHVLPLDDAKELIDYVWDNAFLYAKAKT